MGHYMDYAATSAVRPTEVADAVAEFLRGVGCSPGRGGHSGAMEAARLAFRCRRELARAMDLPGDPGRIAFMQNATHALNTALWGLLAPGDTLVISQYDHNAVLRPSHYLSEQRGVRVRMLSGSPDGSIDLDEAEGLLDGARVLVVNVASNVLGTLMPLRPLARLAHEAGAVVVADAAQSAGHWSRSLASEGSRRGGLHGHKGLLGPPGTGGLWVREGLEVDSMLVGGTGGDSRNREMPLAMPDRLEAGTGNPAGMAGLLAGCRFLARQGVDVIHAHEMSLKTELLDGPGVGAGIARALPARPGRRPGRDRQGRAHGCRVPRRVPRPGTRGPDARGAALRPGGAPDPGNIRGGGRPVLVGVGHRRASMWRRRFRASTPHSGRRRSPVG